MSDRNRTPKKTITDEMVERAARQIANHDGWDWHADDYTSPDPKWEPTDKDDYRKSARAALTAALGEPDA